MDRRAAERLQEADMKCKTRKYADGGKVLADEYGAGRPTFGKAVKARLGSGDGYGKPKMALNAERIYRPATKAGKDLQTAVSNRKKMLDET
jgi:hypothetical protein